MTILYEVTGNIYVNITNRCPCSCTFCIRNNGDGVYGSDSLWLEREPSVEEILAEFDKWTLSDYKEIVFCGYGEPLIRIDDVTAVSKALKSREGCPPIRINTNGLADLIHGRSTAAELADVIDTVSISLNAPNAEEYLAVTRPSFGAGSFEAMLRFADDCLKVVPNVVLTVVDTISEKAIADSKDLADAHGITLRVRHYDS